MDRWDSFFMDVASRSAEMSRALKMKVGAVAVREVEDDEKDYFGE